MRTYQPVSYRYNVYINRYVKRQWQAWSDAVALSDCTRHFLCIFPLLLNFYLVFPRMSQTKVMKADVICSGPCDLPTTLLAGSMKQTSSFQARHLPQSNPGRSSPGGPGFGASFSKPCDCRRSNCSRPVVPRWSAGSRSMASKGLRSLLPTPK